MKQNSWRGSEGGRGLRERVKEGVKEGGGEEEGEGGGEEERG